MLTFIIWSCGFQEPHNSFCKRETRGVYLILKTGYKWDLINCKTMNSLDTTVIFIFVMPEVLNDFHILFWNILSHMNGYGEKTTAYFAVSLHTCPQCSISFGNLCRSQLLFSDKLWTSFSLSEFFLKPFCLPLLNHPLIQRKGPENWLSFNAATARTLSLNKVSVAWI